jgi:hypothetical protein
MIPSPQYFKGEILVHIRKYKQGENGKKVPTKKGATIPIHRLKIFIDIFKETDDAIRRFRLIPVVVGISSPFSGRNHLLIFISGYLDRLTHQLAPKSIRKLNSLSPLNLLIASSVSKVRNAILFLRSDCLTEQDEVLGCLDGRPL